MNDIYFSSDLHFGHGRQFVYGVRGFDSIEEMNEAIVKNFNEVIDDQDDLYLLGDQMLGDYDNIKYLDRLNGKIHLLVGNHDTANRVKLYREHGFDVLGYVDVVKFYGYRFYLSHYPTMTSNFDKELKQATINLYGHTHQQTNFCNGMPWMYHVGVDSHDCRPVEIRTIIDEIKAEYEACKAFL